MATRTRRKRDHKRERENRFFAAKTDEQLAQYIVDTRLAISHLGHLLYAAQKHQEQRRERSTDPA